MPDQLNNQVLNDQSPDLSLQAKCNTCGGSGMIDGSYPCPTCERDKAAKKRVAPSVKREVPKTPVLEELASNQEVKSKMASIDELVAKTKESIALDPMAAIANEVANVVTQALLSVVDSINDISNNVARIADAEEKRGDILAQLRTSKPN